MGEYTLLLDDDFTVVQVLNRLWTTYRMLQSDYGYHMEPFTVRWRQLSYRFESKHDFTVWVTGFTFVARAMQTGAKL